MRHGAPVDRELQLGAGSDERGISESSHFG